MADRTPALATLGGEIILDTCPAVSHHFSGTDGYMQRGWSLLVDVFAFPAMARMALIEAFLLAAYVATIAQPLIYGTASRSFVALMTPVK